MPIGKYYSGHGESVMKDMVRRYGAKKGKAVFYSTANKRKQNPEDDTGLKGHLVGLKRKGKLRKKGR